MGRPSSLSEPARNMVLQLLQMSSQPMTAYMILEHLKNNGIKSAMIIYRALDVLMREGLVHKINELGAYIACDHPEGHTHKLSVLTVCQQCRHVSELHDHNVMHQLENLRNMGIRLMECGVIELPVLCNSCAIAKNI